MLASTRALYEKKLRKLLQSGGRDEHLNGAEKGVLYSDEEHGMTRNTADFFFLSRCFMCFLWLVSYNLMLFCDLYRL